MTPIWIIARRELRALFDLATAYILLVVFVGVNDFLFFRQAEIYGVASLRPMLDLLPWMLLFLVPAVTMRALAEDTRSGVVEIVLAQPITELDLLLGKYLGQLLFLLIALGLTLPIPLALRLGAHVQWGVVIAQYVGAALLMVGLTGVGVWASSVTRNQITAFIVAVAVMFALILVGLDPLLVGLPPRLGAAAAALGVLSHFQGIARGVIDLRDAVYFLSLAAAFLVLAYFALMRRKLTARGDDDPAPQARGRAPDGGARHPQPVRTAHRRPARPDPGTRVHVVAGLAPDPEQPERPRHDQAVRLGGPPAGGGLPEARRGRPAARLPHREQGEGTARRAGPGRGYRRRP